MADEDQPLFAEIRYGNERSTSASAVDIVPNSKVINFQTVDAYGKHLFFVLKDNADGVESMVAGFVISTGSKFLHSCI